MEQLDAHLKQASRKHGHLICDNGSMKRLSVCLILALVKQHERGTGTAEMKSFLVSLQVIQYVTIKQGTSKIIEYIYIYIYIYI